MKIHIINWKILENSAMTSKEYLNIPLTQEQVDVLCSFEGFGRFDAPVWFLGMEEAGGNPELLHRRSTWNSVMDLRDAHINSLGITKHHEGTVALQSTWRRMCALMVLAKRPELFPIKKELSEKKHNELKDALKRYQANSLGRTTGNAETMLCELLPMPKPAENIYGMEDVLPMWKSHEDYKQGVLPNRKKLLARRIAEHRPEVVVAYGKKFWPDYKEIFPNTSFLPASEEQRDLLPSWFPRGNIPDSKCSKILFGFFEERTLVVLVHHFVVIRSNLQISELANFLRMHRLKIQ